MDKGGKKRYKRAILFKESHKPLWPGRQVPPGTGLGGLGGEGGAVPQLFLNSLIGERIQRLVLALRHALNSNCMSTVSTLKISQLLSSAFCMAAKVGRPSIVERGNEVWNKENTIKRGWALLVRSQWKPARQHGPDHKLARRNRRRPWPQRRRRAFPTREFQIYSG